MSRQQLDALPGLVEEATQRVAALAASRGDTDAQRCRVLATDIVHVLITYKAIRVALGALRSGSAPEPDAAGLTIPQQVSFLHTKAAQLQTALVGLLGEVHGRSAIPPTGSLLPGLLTSATFPNILTGAVGNAAETPRGLLPSSTAHSSQQGADLRKPEDITDFLVASLSSLQTAPTRPAPSGAGQQAGLQAPPPLALPHMLPHREAKVGTASRDGTVWVLSCQARRVAIRRAERAWQRAQDAAAAALEKTARGQDRPVPPHACLSCWKRKKRCDHRVRAARPCYLPLPRLTTHPPYRAETMRQLCGARVGV